ncbi:MAG: hypothetical protein JJE52_03885 [Acidimicrobiia bacterium]|nr:hypothetical protein [Acidimicrobiia bacterium]
MSLPAASCVVDTVVLRYFLMADEVDLLLRVVGSPIAVPTIVFDPEEPPEAGDAAKSEIALSIAYQRQASRDPARDRESRGESERAAERLARTADLHAVGDLVVLDLTETELELLGRATSPTGCRTFGLRFPLHAGEAACLALAVERNLVLATDDQDALRALDAHAPGHPYQRIRRLLIDAGEQKLCTKSHANRIHGEMRRLGFWDREAPFPTA